MRKLTILLLLLAASVPAIAVKRVTVRQFEQAVQEVRAKPDQEVVRWLTGFELTERISVDKLASLKALMPGTESQRKLVALSDASAFLNPPAEEVPHNAPMSKEAQQQSLTLASIYIEKTLSKLPNFFATESITLFTNTPEDDEHPTAVSNPPMRYVGLTNATVLYRSGKEVMETKSGEITEQDQRVSANSGLLSSGEFGPVLSTVLTDAQRGKLSWSHWENAPNSPMGVFRYAVPRKESHYKVKVALGGRGKLFEARPGYHGEIAVDPATGTILRLTLRADMTDDDPLATADLMVEYGSIEIGGQSYICPIRSVAIVTASSQSNGAPTSNGLAMGLHTASNSRSDPGSAAEMLMNDVAFENYHLLRSDARMILGSDMQDDGAPPQ
jgi:hypothetical protein